MILEVQNYQNKMCYTNQYHADLTIQLCRYIRVYSFRFQKLISKLMIVNNSSIHPGRRGAGAGLT